jgi:AcrR family transcriptional regulator
MTAEATLISEAQPGRLERRKARTRSAILEAASRLFNEQGYEETSIQQIAEAADTGVGTVYGYFNSKDDVLREVVRLHSAAAIERYRAAVDDETPAPDRICAALDSLAHYMRDNRRVLGAAFRVAARNGRDDEQGTRWLLNSYRQMLSDGIARGELRAVPVGAMARTLFNTYTMAMLGMGVWRGKEDDPRTLADLQEMTRAMLAP